MSKNILLFALNVIKAECSIHANCKSCPFCYTDEYNYKLCGIQENAPSVWTLLGDEACDEQLIF